MKKPFYILSLFFAFSLSALAQGSGKGIDFSVNGANNNHILVDTLHQLDTTSFTIEFWVNAVQNTVNGTYDDAPIFCNKDWNHGQNIGMSLHQSVNGKVKINWTTVGSSRIDWESNALIKGQGWNHVAVTIDRQGLATVYLNGSYAGSTSIAATVGSIGNGTYPWRIAQDGVGTYAGKFLGALDEFRLWKGIRTQTQIRDNMCRKLSGTNPNLLVYYNLDNISGSNVPDLSGNNINGQLNNSVSGNIITSGAAIGDTSTYLYATSYTGQTLQLTSTANGNYKVSNISGAKGIQLYQVNAAPNNYTNITSPAGNSVYYGVFVCDTTAAGTATYTGVYDYSNYPNAITYNSNIIDYNRADNSGVWGNLGAANNTSASTLIKTGLGHQNEFIIGNFAATAPPQPAVVSGGYALDFQPNSAANNHVDIGPLHQLDTASFTIEFWALCRLATTGGGYQDAPFISNKNWTTGGNKGFVLFLQSTGAVCANLTGATGGRVDMATSYNAVGRDWTHVAVTVNRHSMMTIYVNGVSLASSSITTSTGTLYANYDYMLGTDGTGAYMSKFNGAMDEVRIWKGIRTQTQIRDNMCRRINGTDSSLVAYYRLDEGSGTTVTDLSINHSTATISGLVANTWIVSPAPIGDTSFYVYPAGQNWASQTLSGTSTGNGNITAMNVTGMPQGMHIYRVDTLPLYQTGLHPLSGNRTYYGVFPAMVNDSTIQYDVKYDYSNFPAAVTNAAANQLSVNTNHASKWWSNGIITNNSTTHTITLANIGLRREFMIDSAPNMPCLPPSALSETASTQTSATVGWTTGGSTAWNVRSALQGYNLNTATAHNNVTTDPYTVTGLTPGSYYDVYVQDSCAGGASEWIGPVRVNTTPCHAPDSVTVSRILANSANINWSGSGSYVIEYGPTGFSLGIGIQGNATTSPYIMTGLVSNRSYDVYIKADCGGGVYSANIGPLTFHTDSVSGIEEAGNTVNAKIYPNPSVDGKFTILSESVIKGIKVYAMTGELVGRYENLNKNEAQLTLLAAKGIYLVSIETVNGKAYKKISIE